MEKSCVIMFIIICIPLAKPFKNKSRIDGTLNIKRRKRKGFLNAYPTLNITDYSIKGECIVARPSTPELPLSISKFSTMFARPGD